MPKLIPISHISTKQIYYHLSTLKWTLLLVRGHSNLVFMVSLHIILSIGTLLRFAGEEVKWLISFMPPPKAKKKKSQTITAEPMQKWRFSCCVGSTDCNPQSTQAPPYSRSQCSRSSAKLALTYCSWLTLMQTTAFKSLMLGRLWHGEWFGYTLWIWLQQGYLGF